MKKLLLGTTAILGVVGFASAAAADAPRVTVGGFVDFQAAWVDDDAAPVTQQDYGFRNDTEIHFSVDGKTDGGLGYGAVIELEADATNDTTNSGENADRTYVYMDGNWGRFELGTNTDAATALKVDAATIARATGGIDGDWFRFVTPAPTGSYIVRPDLLVSHGGITTPGETENAGKITYYSPSFSGFQLGVSFTPDTDARGQDTFGTGVGGTGIVATGFGQGYEDVISGGLTFNRQFDQVALGLSATGEMGDATTAGLQDLEGYALGASVGFAGFNVAASWADMEGNDGAADVEGDFWTVGAAYDFDAFGASVTYMDSETEIGGAAAGDFQNLVFGVDYAAAPGLTPYAEVSMFEYDAPAAADNDGTVFIVGTQLAF